MPKQITYIFDRRTLSDHAKGKGMSHAAKTSGFQRHSSSVARPTQRVSGSRKTERRMRGAGSQKDLAKRSSRWTRSAEIIRQGVSHLIGQRQHQWYTGLLLS